MNNVNNIIKNFGGLTQMSKILDVPISTIQSWGKNNRIPSWRSDLLQKKAKENGIDLNDSKEGA